MRRLPFLILSPLFSSSHRCWCVDFFYTSSRSLFVFVFFCFTFNLLLLFFLTLSFFLFNLSPFFYFLSFLPFALSLFLSFFLSFFLTLSVSPSLSRSLLPYRKTTKFLPGVFFNYNRFYSFVLPISFVIEKS